MPRSSINVWIVEDNHAQRAEMTTLIDEVFDFRCGGAFADCETMLQALLDAAPEQEPDVVLMDIELHGPRQAKGMNGIEGIAELKKMLPEIAIVMLTIKDGTEVIYNALGAGACGYLIKPPSIDEVVMGVREAHRGGMCMSPPVANKVLNFFHRYTPPKQDYGLTDRELDILNLMAQGLRQKQMAETLGLSHHTIDSHLRNIYQKLHVNTAAQAVAKAIREGHI